MMRKFESCRPSQPVPSLGAMSGSKKISRRREMASAAARVDADMAIGVGQVGSIAHQAAMSELQDLIVDVELAAGGNRPVARADAEPCRPRAGLSSRSQF
jgi:hypothetical protein